jgi:hypothetical protein
VYDRPVRPFVVLLIALGAAGCNQIFGLEAGSGGGDDGGGGDAGGDDDGPPDDGGGEIDAPRRFSQPVAYDVGFAPASLAIGKLSGDGGDDIAFVATASNSLEILSCDPTRTCSITAKTTGSSPNQVIAFHANSDPYQDLAVASPGGTGSVNVHYGDPSGDFFVSGFIPSLGAYRVQAGLFTGGDSIADVVITRNASATLELHAGVSTGGFGPPSTTTLSEPILNLAASDLVIGESTELVVGGTSAVNVFLPDGDGGFFALANAGDGAASAVLAIDLDSDADGDLVFAYVDDDVKVAYGNGAGAFVPAANGVVADIGSKALAAGDADGDGRDDDLVVSTYGGGVQRVRIFHGTDDGDLLEGPIVEPDGGATSVGLADVDGDGRDDLVMVLTSINKVAIAFAD